MFWKFLISIFTKILNRKRLQMSTQLPTKTNVRPRPKMPVQDLKTWSMSWGKDVTAGFIYRMLRLRNNFNWSNDHINWLMSCIAFESNETFSPYIRNLAGSHAVGLIQFMPSTAKGLGTTADKLSKMTAIQQLDYVEKYFTPYFHRIHSLSDMYMAILLPKYIGRPDSSVLFSKGIAYRENSGLDTNDDHKVTKKEATAMVEKKLILGLTPKYAKTMKLGS